MKIKLHGSKPKRIMKEKHVVIHVENPIFMIWMQRCNLITTSQNFQMIREPSSFLLLGPHICAPDLQSTCSSASPFGCSRYISNLSFLKQDSWISLNPLQTPYPELSTSVNTVSSLKPWCLPWSLVMSSNQSASPISSSVKTQVSVTRSLSLLHHYLIQTTVISCLDM